MSNSWLSEARATILNLKSYNLDFTLKDTPGSSILGHIMSKLPTYFKKELTKK